jgi:hypothetical protein
MSRRDCTISAGTLIAMVQEEFVTIIGRGELSGKGEVVVDREEGSKGFSSATDCNVESERRFRPDGRFPSPGVYLGYRFFGRTVNQCSGQKRCVGRGQARLLEELRDNLGPTGHMTPVLGERII